MVGVAACETENRRYAETLLDTGCPWWRWVERRGGPLRGERWVSGGGPWGAGSWLAEGFFLLGKFILF